MTTPLPSRSQSGDQVLSSMGAAGVDTGLIAGIIVGALVCIAMLIFGIILIVRRNKKRGEGKNNPDNSLVLSSLPAENEQQSIINKSQYANSSLVSEQKTQYANTPNNAEEKQSSNYDKVSAVKPTEYSNSSLIEKPKTMEYSNASLALNESGKGNQTSVQYSNSPISQYSNSSLIEKPTTTTEYSNASEAINKRISMQYANKPQTEYANSSDINH